MDYKEDLDYSLLIKKKIVLNDTGEVEIQEVDLEKISKMSVLGIKYVVD